MAMLRPLQESRKIPTAAFLAGVVLAGTGGTWTARSESPGYSLPGLRVIESTRRSGSARAQLLDIVATLQTTNANIARVIGVSRQAVYNWLRGDSPSPQVQRKVDQLSRAAAVIRAAGIHPKTALAQPAIGGRNFWALVQAGKDAEALARQIVSVRHGRAAQRELMASRIAEKRNQGTLRDEDRDDLG